MQATYENETQLLLYCTRPAITETESCHIGKLIQNELDWEYLLRAASQHALLPLFCSRIKQYFPDFLPKDVAKQLKQLFFSYSPRTLLQTGSLLQILDLFQKHDVSSLPFKGPVLAQALYGDMALRSFADLDILIPSGDLQKTYDLLLSVDYSPELQLTPQELGRYSRHEDNLSFVHQSKNVVIELHWDLAGLYLSRPLIYEKLQVDFTTVDLSGHMVNTLSDEHLLVYLCVHGSKHIWERLEWICGVAWLISQKPEPNWQAIFEFAEELQCKRMVFLGILLTHRLFDVELPVTIQHKITVDKRLPRLAKKVCAALFPVDDNDSGQTEKKRFSFFHILIRDNTIDSLRYLCRLCFRPTNVEWQTVRLPARLAFLYYLLRPLRLAGAYWGENRKTTEDRAKTSY